MRARWSASPAWLKALCLVAVPWSLVLSVLGATYLLRPGPGLPLLWLGALGLAPWVAVATRRPP